MTIMMMTMTVDDERNNKGGAYRMPLSRVVVCEAFSPSEGCLFGLDIHGVRCCRFVENGMCPHKPICPGPPG
jgi:hypothetical protein